MVLRVEHANEQTSVVTFLKDCLNLTLDTAAGDSVCACSLVLDFVQCRCREVAVEYQLGARYCAGEVQSGFQRVQRGTRGGLRNDSTIFVVIESTKFPCHMPSLNTCNTRSAITDAVFTPPAGFSTAQGNSRAAVVQGIHSH